MLVKILVRFKEECCHESVNGIVVLVCLAVALVCIVPFLRILDIESYILRVLLELLYPLSR